MIIRDNRTARQRRHDRQRTATIVGTVVVTNLATFTYAGAHASRGWSLVAAWIASSVAAVLVLYWWALRDERAAASWDHSLRALADAQDGVDPETQAAHDDDPAGL